MSRRSIRQKIEALRQEPDHIKLRAVTLMTAISGGALAIMWLTIFLPLQLHFNQGSSDQELPEQALIEGIQGSSGLVGGTQQTAPTVVPTPPVFSTSTTRVNPFPTATPTPITTPASDPNTGTDPSLTPSQ